MDTKKNIIITNKNGKKTNYHVLCTFDSNKNHKSYMIYTDFSKNSDNCINVYYACYEQGHDSELKAVETQEEIALMDSILSSLEQELNNKFRKSSTL